MGGEWKVDGKWNISFCNGLSIAIIVLYVVLLFYFARKNRKEDISIEKLNSKLHCVSVTSEGIQNLIQYLHTKIKDILYNKDSLDIFNASTSICRQVYLSLSDIFPSNKDNITVNIYRKDRDDNGNLFCSMIAHEGTKSPPKIYLRKLFLDEKKGEKKYLCQKIFINNNPDYYILMTKEEISKNFSLKKNNRGKYSQYIGVPLTNNDNNIVALLEINVLNDNKIFDSREDALDFILISLCPFISIFMLCINLDDLLNEINNN